MRRSTSSGADEADAYSVVVMAKYPRPGQVKTRLAHHLGEDGAAMLSYAFLRDLEERLTLAGIATTFAYWPPDAPFRTLVDTDRVIPQQGVDLGERMAAAASHVLAETQRPVLLLGADCPHVPIHLVQAAGRALCRGDDVALGPSEDGGYYLLGMRQLLPELFRDMPWGTTRVYQETLARCIALGLRRKQLPPTFDVDTGRDYLRLATMIRDGVVRLPCTEEFVRTRHVR